MVWGDKNWNDAPSPLELSLSLHVVKDSHFNQTLLRMLCALFSTRHIFSLLSLTFTRNPAEAI